MNNVNFWVYLLVMAGTTYLVRMIPFVLIKKKIKNRFILSFLHYIPYTVLATMTIPAIFYSTSDIFSATAGFAAAVMLSFKGKSLVKVAAVSCGVVFVIETLMAFFA